MKTIFSFNGGEDASLEEALLAVRLKGAGSDHGEAAKTPEGNRLSALTTILTSSAAGPLPEMWPASSSLQGVLLGGLSRHGPAPVLPPGVVASSGGMGGRSSAPVVGTSRPSSGQGCVRSSAPPAGAAGRQRIPPVIEGDREQTPSKKLMVRGISYKYLPWIFPRSAQGIGDWEGYLFPTKSVNHTFIYLNVQGSFVLSAFGRCFSPWRGGRGVSQSGAIDLSPLESAPDLPPPTPSALHGSSLLPMTTTDGFAFAFETADGPGSRHHAGSSGHHSSASSAAGVGSPLSTSGVPTVRTAGEFDDGLAPLGVLRLRAQSCPLGYPRGSRDLSLDLSPDLPDLIRVDLPTPEELPLELAAEAATEAVGLSAEEGPAPNVSAAAVGGNFLEAAGAAVVSAPVRPTYLEGFEGAARKVQERSVMKLMRPMTDPVSELQLQLQLQLHCWPVFVVTCDP